MWTLRKRYTSEVKSYGFFYIGRDGLTFYSDLHLLTLTYEGAYNSASNSTENPSMDVSSATKNSSSKMSLDLQLHIMVPRIETIQLSSEVGFDTVQYDIKVPEFETKEIIKYFELK